MKSFISAIVLCAFIFSTSSFAGPANVLNYARFNVAIEALHTGVMLNEGITIEEENMGDMPIPMSSIPIAGMIAGAIIFFIGQTGEYAFDGGESSSYGIGIFAVFGCSLLMSFANPPSKYDISQSLKQDQVLTQIASNFQKVYSIDESKLPILKKI